jgi:hypothetical protein
MNYSKIWDSNIAEKYSTAMLIKQGSKVVSINRPLNNVILLLNLKRTCYLNRKNCFKQLKTKYGDYPYPRGFRCKKIMMESPFTCIFLCKLDL